MLVFLMAGRHHRSIPSPLLFKFFPPKIPALYNLHNNISNAVFSPELPDWFRFAECEQSCNLNSEDDFLLPAMPETLQVRPVSGKAVNERMPLDQIESSESVDDDIVRISNALNVRFRCPEEVVLTLSNYSPKISKDLVDRMLKKFSNDWIPALGFFMWVGAHSNFNHSPDSYDTMVDILGKTKQFDAMWSLVEEMSRHGGLVSLSTMTKVIRRLAGAARWRGAVRAFHGVEQFGIRKDTAAMNILLDSLCKERSAMRARDAFLELRGDIPPNASSFNILIHGWCKARKLGEAWQTLEEMKEFGFKPCVITYTSLVEAYCLESDFLKVDGILDEMRAQGCPPNVVTYTIIMHSYGKMNDTQAALMVLDKMKSDGCLPDSSVYNSLIYILARAGRLEEAYKVYDEMNEKGISPDVTTFNTLISVACRHFREEDALKFLAKMGESSCKPNFKTYSPLLKLSCSRKWMRLLMYLVGHMFRRDISLDLGTYTLLVRGLCRTGKVRLACIFYEEMVLKGFTPKSHSSAMLLELLGKKNMDATISRVQKLMMKAQNMRRQTL